MGETTLVVIGVAIVAALFLAFLLRGDGSRWARVLSLAIQDEADRRYEWACYHYAVALKAGAAPAVCEPKIVQLWRDHGPFSFAGVGVALQETYCAKSRTCGQGYHTLTVEDIRSIVASTSGPADDSTA